MALSLLVQSLGSPLPSARSSDAAVKAHFQDADPLTLRRLALLSTIERWDDTRLQSDLLEEVMRRNDPTQLGIFLASSHLTKHLAKKGALGTSLCKAAEMNHFHAASILARRVTEVERGRAALRAAYAGNLESFESILRASSTVQEESARLRSALIASSSAGRLRFVKQIVAHLHAIRINSISLAAVTLAASNGHIEIGQMLVDQFSWTQNESNQLKRMNLIKSRTQEYSADTNLQAAIAQNNARSILSLNTFDELSLVSSCKQPNGNSVSAFLSLHTANLTSSLLSRCAAEAGQAGSFASLSRIVLRAKQQHLNEREVASMIGNALVASSRNGHLDLVVRLLSSVNEELLQRALRAACASGQSGVIDVFLRRRVLTVDIKFTRELIMICLIGGYLDCIDILRHSLTNSENILAEVARASMMRAAKSGDAKLASDSASLLESSMAGGSATAAVLTARRLGFEDVALALKPLRRGISSFSHGLAFETLNNDVLDRVLSFLDLLSLAKCNQVSKRFALRPRQVEQTTRCLIGDYISTRRSNETIETPGELLRLAVVLSSSSLQPQAFYLETTSKSRALNTVLAQAVQESWDDVTNICGELIARSVDADSGPITETLLGMTSLDGTPVVPNVRILEVFNSAVRKECMRALGVICKLALPKRRLSTRALVEASRVESNAGNAQTLFSLLAAMSREALASRRERDALWARRRMEWERRGGIWGQAQQEEERIHGKTEQEQDWDDAIGGALRRAASAGHIEIVASLYKMLRARGRLTDFAGDSEKAFEGACRGNFDAVLAEVMKNFRVSEVQLRDGLTVAARNGNAQIAKMLVMEGHIPVTEVRYRFQDAARRGHVNAVQTLLLTGAIESKTCESALEEAVRREHEDCKVVLEKALARLLDFEKNESSVGGT